MKKALFVAMITFSMVCTGLIQIANAQSTTSASGVTVGICATSWNFGEFDAQTIASHFDMSSSWYVGPPPNSNDYSAKMNQVHSLNPDYKFFMYRDCISTAQFTTAELNNAVAHGWILKDSSGKLVSSTSYSGYYIVDMGNPEYQQWFASNKVKACLDQYPAFDGIFADNSMKYTAAELEWGASARPINPRTRTYWTDAETVTACQGMLNAIANAITPKLLFSNGVWNGPTFWGSNSYRQTISGVPGLNAILSEGTWAFNYGSGNSFWYSESDWVQSVDFVNWVQTNFLSGHPERSCVTTCRVDAATANLPPGTTRDQIMMFGFCSELLGAGSVGHNVIYFGEIMNYPDLIALWQTLRTTDVGDPLATYYKVSGTSVYARDFVNGKVMVNPSSTPYTVALSNTYKTLNGQLINSINIQPHTGVILTTTTSMMGIVFSDIFESGNLSKWTFAGPDQWNGAQCTLALQSQIIHSGNYAVLMTTPGLVQNEAAECVKDVELPEFNLSFYTKILSWDRRLGSNMYLAWAYGSNWYQSYLCFASLVQDWDGTYKWSLNVRTGQSTDANYLSAPTTIDNNWHHIELHWKEDASTGFAELFVDSIMVVATPYVDTSTFGNARHLFAGLAVNSGSAGVGSKAIVVIDDVVIART